MTVWVEWVLALLLAASQPLWKAIFDLSPNAGVSASPAVLCLASLAALCASAGLLAARPQCARLPRAVWNGWSLGAQKERTPSLPDLSDPILGVVYAPLFNPRTIHAGRMLLRGMDTTAALAGCLIALLVSAAQVAACLTGEAPAKLLPFSLLLAGCFLFWAISAFVSIRAIGRTVSIEMQPDFTEHPLLWISLLPLILLLYGFSCALIPLLSLRLDQYPVSGFTVVLYALVRSLLIVVVQYLLLHAPAKLARLSAPRKPHLRQWTFYATTGIACFVWLTIDYFHPVFRV